ncbi:MAG: NAD-dependent epimerase/dehydratase family protein [Bryobacteraceae bacterium]
MWLVTGATGFIGGHLLQALSTDAGAQPVRCLVRPKHAGRALPEAVEIAPGDLESGAGLSEALAGVETVIHLAGVTKALAPEGYYSGNVTGTRNLVRAIAAEHRPVRLVHVSSLAAVGPSPDGTPADEQTAPHPFTHYGRSKLAGEILVRQEYPGAVILRPPVVYGPRDTDVFEIIKPLAKGWAVEIGGGDRWFSAIYVGDLAAGLIAAARSPRAAGQTYFIAHPAAVNWKELTAVAARLMNIRPRPLTVPVWAARTAGFFAEMGSKLTRKPSIISREKVAEAECRWWLCDPSRLAREVGFSAATGIEQGLRETLIWYKRAGWLQY